MKFQKNPREAIKIPPKNGPIKRVPVMVSTLVAKAFPIASVGTVLATSAWRKGCINDRQTPEINTYVYACHTSIQSKSIKKAKKKAIQVMNSWRLITSLRRSRRSPRTPPHGLTKRDGRVFMAPIVITSKAEDVVPWVRCWTNQPTESSCSHWAPFAKKFPIHKNL